MSHPLRIALDITHPAHFHFFKHAVVTWQQQGHDVLILSRDKDLTLQLLEEAGMAHHCLTKVRMGLVGLAIEMVQHSLGVYQAMRRHRSQVVAAIGGTFIVHPARLLGIPSLVFYDTENARLSNRITYPFATHILTPRAYLDDLGPKQERYNGYHETAYLHPARFTPNPAKLAVEGIEPGEPFSFVRLVSWASHHDVGDYGVTNVEGVVAALARHGKVIISSEMPLPEALRRYERRGLAGDVHHVLAYASLCFGESATMCSEAVQLGVPAIFLSTSRRGYTDEQEKRYGMCYNFNGDRAVQAAALAQAEDILRQGKSAYREKHAFMMSELIDVSAYIVDRVARAAAEHSQQKHATALGEYRQS